MLTQQYGSRDPSSVSFWVRSAGSLAAYSVGGILHLFSSVKSNVLGARCSSVVTAFTHGVGVTCSSVVRAFTDGAMGRRIDPSWWTH